MRIALVNPPWSFEHSIYFGCREPHLPLELGYARAHLERAGHAAIIVDAHMFGLEAAEAAERVARFRPDMTVVTTAPTYLFWRCAQPELRIPRLFLDALGSRGGLTVAVGPHGSCTPSAALRKLGVDVVIRGECEEALAEIADASRPGAVSGTALRIDDAVFMTGPPRTTRFADEPPLAWEPEWIGRHRHHHHRFGDAVAGPGAEIEASRGCPFTCTFCAKSDFRDAYRRRSLPLVLEELDRLIAAGARYVYFIDEIFLPDAALLEALAGRPVQFGVQTRIDLWKPDMLDLLGRAGCVSIEAGVESLTMEGRSALDKKCRMTTGDITSLLIRARRTVPFVQANLIATADDDRSAVSSWRETLRREGVWANDPVPLYPYPSSPEYRRLFGPPDDRAWERAHAHYLDRFQLFSDIQERRPLPLEALEEVCR